MNDAFISAVGNIVRDPEVKTGKSGTKYCTFSIAVNTNARDRTNTENFISNFYSCTMFGDSAIETFAKHAGKGTQAFVTGEFNATPFKGNDGTDRMSLNIVLNRPPKLLARLKGADAAPARASARTGNTVNTQDMEEVQEGDIEAIFG